MIKQIIKWYKYNFTDISEPVYSIAKLMQDYDKWVSKNNMKGYTLSVYLGIQEIVCSDKGGNTIARITPTPAEVKYLRPFQEALDDYFKQKENLENLENRKIITNRLGEILIKEKEE